MHQLKLLFLFVLLSTVTHSQQAALVFKRRNNVVTTFWKGDFIAFQTDNKQWQKGELMRIQNDSFYIRPMVVRYGYLGNDTTYYEVQGYALGDVYAMPKRGVLIDWRGDGYGISGEGGHVHFYWIKGGWLFRALGIGYAGLHLLNGALYNHSSFNGPSLGIAAGVAAIGFLLKHTYKLTLRTGKKYHLQILTFAEQPAALNK